MLKRDFSHWNTQGAAVILKNHVVLAPESLDKAGWLFAKNENSLATSWILDLELQMGNTKQTSRGGAGVGIYYVQTLDLASSHKEGLFGYANRFNGLGVYLNSVLKQESKSRDVLNAVQGYYNDGTSQVNVFGDKRSICYRKFRNLPPGHAFNLRITYDSPLLTVTTYDIFTQTWEHCFSMQADLDFNGYFLFSGASGAHSPDYVYVKSVKLFNFKQMENGQNQHFLDARRAKLDHEKVADKGAKDLLEKHSERDLKDMNVANVSARNASELMRRAPKEHKRL